MIEKLTPAQEAMIPKYVDEFFKIGTSTQPCDRPKAENAVAMSYEYQKLARPDFIWADSPFVGQKMAAQIKKSGALGKTLPEIKAQIARGDFDVTPEEIVEQAEFSSYGSFEAYWVAFYSFISEQLQPHPDPLVNILKDIVINCGVYWTFKEIIVMTDKPSEIHWNNDQLSNESDMAIKYRDGQGVCAYKGNVYKTLLEMAVAIETEKDSKK